MSDTISIKIRLQDAAKFAGETRIASVEVDELGDAAARANRKSRDASGGLNLLQKSSKLLKPALIAAGLGIFVQMLSTGATGAVGFAAALLPVAGLLGALPGALLMAAQGAGALKLAFTGVGGALGGLHSEIEPKKFEALSGPAQAFVLVLNRLKAPIIAIQRAVQGNMFGGLTAGLAAASPAIAVLAGPLAQTGKVFGVLGDKLGRLVGSRGFLSDLRSQANFNNVQLMLLGGAGLHVVDSLRQLTVTSRPLIHWLVLLAAGWAATIDKTVTADRANGKLAHGFGIVKHAVSDVFKIVGNLGKSIFDVANIGRKKLGESLLTSLVKGSESLKKWTQSGKGIQAIGRFFERAKPVVYSFVQLLGAAAKDFLSFGTKGEGSKTLTALFTQMRLEVLPELLVVTENVTKLFGFITKTLPGGGWLITAGYILSKLGVAGPVAKAAFGASGRILGLIFGSQFETVALASMYAVDWVKSLASGSALAKFATAGGTAGGAFQAAFIAAAAVIGFELGKYIGEHIQFHFDPKRIAEGKSPIWVGPKEESHGKESKLLHEKLIGKTTLAPKQETQLHKALTHKGPSKVTSAIPEAVLHPARKGSAFVPALRAPTTTEVRLSGASAGTGSPAPIHVHSYTTLKLDGKPVAHSTGEVVARRAALA